MKCPKCDGETAVIDSRPDDTGIRRRRVCLDCEYRFTTRERLEPREVAQRRVMEIAQHAY